MPETLVYKERTRPDWLKIKLDTSGDFLRVQKLMRLKEFQYQRLHKDKHRIFHASYIQVIML